MKKFFLPVFLCFFSLSACDYKIPLSSDHSIPIDQSVLGSWKMTSEDTGDGKTGIRIHRFSDTEYSIHYYADKHDFYFRAYRINVGGISAVQLEMIATDAGAIGSDENDRYQVASYRMVDDALEIRTLNTQLVDDDLADSESLRKAFIEHKDNPELFNDPGLFKRVRK